MPLKRFGHIAITCGLFLFAAFALFKLFPHFPDTWGNLTTWFFAQQKLFRQDMITTLRDLKSGSTVEAGLRLICMSFVYGVFHAAGPGHGKAVISTYLLTNSEHIRRGITIAVAAAFCQGVVAITLVYGLIWLADWRSSETMTAIRWSERMSYTLLIALGVWLLVRVMAPLWTNRAPATPDDAHCCDHTPNPEQIAKATSLRTALALILTIGARPCSGAVLVLIFAHAIHIHWAGILASLAMAGGTAITVSVLALTAVKAHTFGAGIGRRLTQSTILNVLGLGIKLACAGILITLGSTMLWHSFSQQLSSGLL